MVHIQIHFNHKISVFLVLTIKNQSLKFWKHGELKQSYIVQIPKAFLKKTNLVESRALVKISTNCFFVVTCFITTVLFSTNSLIKWCLMSICFVLECCTGFLEIFIALVLS